MVASLQCPRETSASPSSFYLASRGSAYDMSAYVADAVIWSAYAGNVATAILGRTTLPQTGHSIKGGFWVASKIRVHLTLHCFKRPSRVGSPFALRCGESASMWFPSRSSSVAELTAVFRIWGCQRPSCLSRTGRRFSLDFSSVFLSPLAAARPRA